MCQKIANAKFRAYRKLIGVCYLGQIERRIIYDSGSEQFAVTLVTNVCYRRGLLERDAKQVPLSLLAETLEISTGALPRGSLSRTGNRVRHNYSLSRSISACVRETASASPVITKRNVSGSDKLLFIRSCSGWCISRFESPFGKFISVTLHLRAKRKVFFEISILEASRRRFWRVWKEFTFYGVSWWWLEDNFVSVEVATMTVMRTGKFKIDNFV